ncbi:UNVERIFIED_CONTAM: hypothetical protein O8I53_13545 [Campylobacter lari]
MKKTKLILGVSVTTFLLPTSLAISCENKTNEITLYLGNITYPASSESLKKLENYLNEKLIENNSNSKVTVKSATKDDSVLIDDIMKEKNTIGFPAVGSYYKKYNEAKLSTQLFLRTLTRSFKHVAYGDEYEDQQAIYQNNIFNGIGEENIVNGSYKN